MSLALVIAGILFLAYGIGHALTATMSGDPWRAERGQRGGALIALAGACLVLGWWLW